MKWALAGFTRGAGFDEGAIEVGVEFIVDAWGNWRTRLDWGEVQRRF